MCHIILKSTDGVSETNKEGAYTYQSNQDGEDNVHSPLEDNCISTL